MASKRASSKGKSGYSGLDLAEVERVLAFMEKRGLAELEYSQGDLRIALKRAGFSAGVAAATAPASAPVRTAAAATTSKPAAAEPAAEEHHIIKSPIVGTFFAAANPDAPPFVKVGDRVKQGQVVCIIEAMKLMNEIEADVSGVIVRVLVENAQPVEYGQQLFAIRPDGKK